MFIFFSICLWLTVALNIFIFTLETLAPRSAYTQKVFKLQATDLTSTYVTLFKNIGVYNLLIGVGLAIGYLLWQPALIGYLSVFMFVAACYGAITSNVGIFFKQGTLPLLTFISLCLISIS